MLSKPLQGTYVIWNAVSDRAGQKLAITFHGNNQYVTATPLNYGESQKWIVTNYIDRRTQSISPANDRSLQAAWGDTGVIVYPAGGYVWTIRSVGSGYNTIQDGGEYVYWSMSSAISNEHVIITAGSGTMPSVQRWVLQKV